MRRTLIRLEQISVGLPLYFYLPIPPPAQEHDYEPVSLAPEMAAVDENEAVFRSSKNGLAVLDQDGHWQGSASDPKPSVANLNSSPESGR